MMPKQLSSLLLQAQSPSLSTDSPGARENRVDDFDLISIDRHLGVEAVAPRRLALPPECVAVAPIQGDFVDREDAGGPRGEERQIARERERRGEAAIAVSR